MKKKFWLIIMGSTIGVIILPMVIDWFIIGNRFPSNISNADWVGFLGGYIGAIMGGVISLFGILWTINFTREQNRADRELQIRPCLDIRYIPSVNKISKETSWLGYVMVNEYNENKADIHEVERGLLYLKNIGNGPATNIDVSVFVENIKVKYTAKFTNKNTRVTSNSIRQGEEAAISFIITNNSIAPSKDDFTWIEYGFGIYNEKKFPMPSAYNIIILLRYKDLLGNIFTQELKFNAIYSMSYDKENGGKYSCDLELKEKGVPQIN